MDTTTLPPIPKEVEDAIFDVALSLDSERNREAFLQTVYRDHPEGLARMRRLLELSGESSALFLDLCRHRSEMAKEILKAGPQDVSMEEPQDGSQEPAGTRIGPYLLLSRIGEGGCGVVYEAEQQEPVRRRLALKVLRAGMDTESVIARFNAERQALALMDHPNIAHVFDAGATDQGRPFFVMERVEGERITAFCDRERLDIFARIDLFVQVCHAIQHAHQKGVIHRDIKPSNILVTVQDGVPRPKVIDFGIAKAAGSRSPGRSWTMHDQIVGTPPYMSPEQVDMSGIDVDTRSDVYSLGALLHELLGGQPPFDEATLAGLGISEMRRILLEVEPPMLSRMLAGLPAEKLEKIAASRNDQPARLIARIRGDLDWIVAMALAKDRDARYQTANALAADLRRFLAHEPVVARRPNRVYLLRKFVRRNRVACCLGLAMAISVLAGLGASTTLYFRERAALAEQERLGRVEAWLREQAQARADVSLAAVLLSEGEIEAADALLRESPLESIEPSREAAGVFRMLGEWNAVYGRWPQAEQCFLLLDQANRLDDPVKIVEHVDLLEIAPALLKGGNREAYETFRRATLDRHLPATNALQAEHLLKVCLLTPADSTLLERLAPVSEVCERGVQSGNHARHPAWEAFSMTLYHFRRGDDARALEWAQKTLARGDQVGARNAATRSIMAMAKLRSGDPSGAAEDLEAASRILKNRSPYATDARDGMRGTWHSWAVAEILVEEAVKQLGNNREQAGSAVPGRG